MKSLWLGVTIFGLACSGTGFAQVSGTCANPFEVPLKLNGSLDIQTRSAQIEIVGTDEEKLRISCRLERKDDAKDISIRFSVNGPSSELNLDGGPRNNVRIHIEVPRHSNLKLNAFAGEVNVRQIAGNKDIDLEMGKISISPVTVSEYGSIEASTLIGNLFAPSLGFKRKGGFFRHISNQTSGPYHLQAHVRMGSIFFD